MAAISQTKTSDVHKPLALRPQHSLSSPRPLQKIGPDLKNVNFTRVQNFVFKGNTEAHRPLNHRFVYQATCDLQKKYDLIIKRYEIFKSKLTPAQWEGLIRLESLQRSMLTYRGLLGKGSAGYVYRVAKGGKEFAIKLSASHEQVQVLQKEFTVLKSLQSRPYVPRLFSSKMMRTAPCEAGFIMELLSPDFENVALLDELTLNLRELKDFAREFLRILSDLNMQKRIALDLKPANFTHFAKKITLFDFDSWFLEREINIPAPIGTLDYKPPELFCQRLPYLCSVNMWQLGCILYEAYTSDTLFFDLVRGYPEFDDENREKIESQKRWIFLVTRLLGPIPAQFIENGHNPRLPALLQKDKDGNGYVLKSEFAASEKKENFKRPLDEHIMHKAKEKGDSEDEAKDLIDLIKAMVKYENRITPDEALKHRFLTKQEKPEPAPDKKG